MFPPVAEAPTGEPAPELAPSQEELPAERVQRPPPDISRYEVRLPGREPGARPIPPSESPPPEHDREAQQAEPIDREGSPEGTAAEVGTPPGADETGVLLLALEDPDPFVRAKALGGLAGRPGVDQALIAQLGDDYPMVRREAVRALRLARSSQASQALVDVVSHDPSAEVREEAVSVLAEHLQRGASEGS
jgi:hypothetical protein